MKRHLWTLSETLVPTRHVFDFNQALMDFGAMVCVARNPRCLVLPDGEELPRFGRRACRSHRRRRRARRPVPDRAAAEGRASRRLLGVSRAANATRASRSPHAWLAELREELGRRRRHRRGDLHDHPRLSGSLASSCISSDASCAATPTPQVGQEMRWVRREELATLQFPPADAELIRC